MENNYYFGKKADAFFWAVYNPILHDELHLVLQKKDYEVNRFFCPMSLIDKKRFERIESDNMHDLFFQPRFDHWKILSTVPEIARLLMGRPLPTLGLQALATGLILGFREIHVIGMDFYQSTSIRYAFELPEKIKNGMSSVHTTPGYEKKAHNFETDLHAYHVIRNKFPEARIYSLSKNSYFTELAPISQKRSQGNNPYMKKMDRPTYLGETVQQDTKPTFQNRVRQRLNRILKKAIGSLLKTKIGIRSVNGIKAYLRDIIEEF